MRCTWEGNNMEEEGDIFQAARRDGKQRRGADNEVQGKQRLAGRRNNVIGVAAHLDDEPRATSWFSIKFADTMIAIMSFFNLLNDIIVFLHGDAFSQ